MRTTRPSTRLAAAALTGLVAMALAAPAHADPPWRGRPPEAKHHGPAPRPAPAPAAPWRAAPAPAPAPVRPLPPGHGGEPPGQWKKHHEHDHHPAPAPAPHMHVVPPPPPTAQVQVVVPAPPPPPVVSAGVHVHVGAPAPAPAPVYVAPAPAPVYAAPAPPPPPHHHGGGPVSIVGTVRTPHGHPVAGVMMVLAGTSEARVVTDGAGRYAFTGLRPGSYAVRPNGPCAFGPDVVNLNGLHHGVVQDFNATCR